MWKIGVQRASQEQAQWSNTPNELKRFMASAFLADTVWHTSKLR